MQVTEVLVDKVVGIPGFVCADVVAMDITSGY